MADNDDKNVIEQLVFFGLVLDRVTLTKPHHSFIGTIKTHRYTMNRVSKIDSIKTNRSTKNYVDKIGV
jgi:hypothetical protein